MEVLSYSRSQLGRLPAAATVVLDSPAIFDIAGPGAVTCIQGLLTNDVVKPGPNSLVYGALLTPKGMIVVDYWTIREGDRFVMVADRGAEAASRGLFTRQLPPRLARLTERTGDWRAAWLIGDESPGVARVVLGAVPAPGRSGRLDDGAEPGLVARGTDRSPFELLVVGPAAGIESLAERMREAGARAGEAVDLRAARVVAGVPTLGAEIDATTLPQEAGFEALDGVSYTKGCYVGQETVARVHFRGHPNWVLRGVLVSRPDAIPAGEIHRDGKVVATMGTVLRLEDGTGVGLASVRREIEVGETLTEAATTIRIVPLPIQLETL